MPSMTRRSGLGLMLGMLGVAGPAAAKATTLLNVSYDPTRELYREINPAFIASWNNFLFALVLANEETKTLPVAVLGYIGYNSIQWGTLMAAATLITLPVLVLALCVQRYIVRGLVAGAVTG